MLGAEQPLLLEPGVDATGGVHVHPGEARELPDAGKAVAGAEGTSGDHPAELPGELDAQRQVALTVHAEVDPAGALALVLRERKLGEGRFGEEVLCHCASTVAAKLC